VELDEALGAIADEFRDLCMPLRTFVEGGAVDLAVRQRAAEIV
jgi:hypothetical protein